MIGILPCTLGWIIAGQWGLTSAALAILLLFAAFGFTADEVVRRRFQARPLKTTGVKKTMEWVRQSGFPIPVSGINFYQWDDPSPGVLVCKSWLKKPKVFLSTGLVTTASEDELRAKLQSALKKATSLTLAWDTLWAATEDTGLSLSGFFSKTVRISSVSPARAVFSWVFSALASLFRDRTPVAEADSSLLIP